MITILVSFAIAIAVVGIGFLLAWFVQEENVYGVTTMLVILTTAVIYFLIITIFQY